MQAAKGKARGVLCCTPHVPDEIVLGAVLRILRERYEITILEQLRARHIARLDLHRFPLPLLALAFASRSTWWHIVIWEAQPVPLALHKLRQQESILRNGRTDARGFLRHAGTKLGDIRCGKAGHENLA